MSEEINTNPNQDYAAAAKRILNTDKQPNFGARRAVAAGLALTAAGVAGYGIGQGIEKIAEATDMKVVATESFTLDRGDSIIGAAEEQAETFFNTNNLDLTAIPYDQITYEAQSALDKNIELNGHDTPQPGDTFAMLIETNDLGAYNIQITPFEQPPAIAENTIPSPLQSESGATNDGVVSNNN
ncbi:hypothetical protein H7200_03025 [Candidatus Saccharibacteria bacterium]|nr:hypothetical protein [Candidatus Saccharibacteria bacterium]